MRETSFHTENSMKEKNSCLIFCHICHFQSKIMIFQVFSKVYFFFFFAKGQFQVQKCSFVREAKNSFIYDNVQGFLNLKKKMGTTKTWSISKEKGLLSIQVFLSGKNVNEA